MSRERSTGGERSPSDATAEVVPEVLEWFVTAFLLLAGLLATLGGVAILWASGENLIATAIADGIAEGTIRTEGLTPGEVTEIATNTAVWLGVGFVVAGLTVIVVALYYLRGRRRARAAPDGGSHRELVFSNAVLGAVATGVLMGVPGSPILGGGVAGYLHRQRETNVITAGALSGLLAGLPLVLLALCTSVGVYAGVSSAGYDGLAVVVLFGFQIGALVTLLYFVGLAALGGYLADAIAEDDDRLDRGHDDEDRGGVPNDGGYGGGPDEVDPAAGPNDDRFAGSENAAGWDDERRGGADHERSGGADHERGDSTDSHANGPE